jgi:hypothetical protein
MRNIQQITINGFDSHSLCYLEALGMSKVFEAYASIGEEILEDGAIKAREITDEKLFAVKAAIGVI